MPKTALQMTEAEWKKYNPSRNMHSNAHDGAIRLPVGRDDALKVARQAAGLLRERFGARKVVVFGSLAGNTGFTEFSDIDLAAWGISGDEYYRAVAAVAGLSDRYQIDLVDPELCRASIKQIILEQGVEV